MKHFASQVTVAVISAGITLIATLYVTYRANEIKYLDYATWNSKGILNQLIKIPGTDSLKVFLNNRQLTNLSEFGVSIVNLGSQDVSDVPIFIELYPNENEGPLNVLSAAVFDHNDTQESIEVVEDLKPVHNDGERYRYVVHTFNREEDFKNSFYVRFLLEGDVLPNFLVQSDKAGVKVREFVPKKDFRDSPWFWLAVLVLVFISAFLAKVLAALSISNKSPAQNS